MSERTTETIAHTAVSTDREEARTFLFCFVPQSLPLCFHDPLSLRLLDLSHNPETTWWNQMWSQDSNMFIVTQAHHAQLTAAALTVVGLQSHRPFALVCISSSSRQLFEKACMNMT